MTYLSEILLEILNLIGEMSPYLLLGFLLAGLMHEFVPGTLYSKHLSKNNFGSVIMAALFGIPLPLCSCGVIPTAMGLRREGASKGATIAFLTATPQTGVDSIIATYSLMGLPFAIIRPIAAFATALFGGMFCNVIDSEETKPQDTKPKDIHSEEKESIIHRLGEAIEYAFIEMMEDIGKWLVVGLAIAGCITAAVPDSWFILFRDNTAMSILFVLLFSIPMYLCATGSIPIAVALMLKGLTPGAALVLLMAGPASNAASILVINKVLGKKAMFVYLFSIILGAVVFAFGIDMLLPREWFNISLIGHAGCFDEGLGWFNIGCTILMILLLVNALTPLKLFKGHECHCHCQEEGCSCHHEERPYIYKVEGMNCNHCAENVKKAIASIEGVEEVYVDLKTGLAHVEGNHNTEHLIATVESIGFKVNTHN